MSKLFAVALGILPAIGGFVDVGDLVTSAVVGSRFGLRLAWVVVVGVVGIMVFAEMSAGSRPSPTGRPSTWCASGSGRGWAWSISRRPSP